MKEKSLLDASVSYDYPYRGPSIIYDHAYQLSGAQKTVAPAKYRVAHNDSTAYQPYHESFDIGLSAYAFISTMSLLWTATFTMVVVLRLHSRTTSMTNKVDTNYVWTGLSGTLDVERPFNLLSRLLPAIERKSGSANNIIENDIFVSTNSFSNVYSTSCSHERSYSHEYYKVMKKHFSVMNLRDNE